MITAQRLQLLTTYNAGALHKAVGKRAEGYDFKGAKFLGITNGGQFCYDVEYMDKHEKDKVSRTKVFVSKHPYGSLEADY